MHIAIWNNLLTDSYLELDQKLVSTLPLTKPVKQKVIGSVFFFELAQKLSIDEELVLAAAVNFVDSTGPKYPFEEDEDLLIKNTMAFSYIEDLNKYKIAVFKLELGKTYSLVFYNDTLSAKEVFEKALPSINQDSVVYHSPIGFNYQNIDYGLHSVLTTIE